MITIISRMDEEKENIKVNCVINSDNVAIVLEIEAILYSIFKKRPDDFMHALDNMMVRIRDAKNNISN